MFLEKNKMHDAKKKYGQNFLNNQGIINKIVDVIEPKGKKILEIGPGLGAITQLIANQAEKFIAFEIDPDMKNYLIENKILQESQIQLQDFLDANLTSYSNYDVVGNIPYYITSDIILKLLDHRYLFNSAILMVQAEVADRLIAQPNQADYSKLSITTQYVANVEKVFKVKKTQFTPQPKVDSAIVKLTFKKEQNDNFEQLKEFFKLCFLARRKKLKFSLKQKYSNEQIEKAYQKMNFGELVRIQELSLKQIVDLYNCLNTMKENNVH
ncbi:16S rRNA (adenine(1518)-N(6)/adenine(1519)-N(6))-dimethyltransferase RsmA [Mycoplasmopsis iners]|uniref:16S rRNA (adenine(1518)-N(6)/adenine(1519)-N(6))- dimethyltransferase RsmA n=1 Tax=Mycoplasmopsis iners TaxID=76630 RepID=UPI00049629A8|nr:16S rRNA (adenine(1518)-N(6)/adenine(1519)-N(6))-dimethyltransferase RsmA [Mycoplasmopsis iners]